MSTPYTVAPEATSPTGGRGTSARETMELPDGRRLGFAAFGPPDGAPCFVFHGFAGSRNTPSWLFPPALLRRAGVRMVGVDRPGYGLTTQSDGGFADWPAAIAALADYLGIARFAVLGHSMGAAFALACGVHLPQRLTTLLILSGMGPVDERLPFAVQSTTGALFWRLAQHRASWLLAPLCRLSAALVQAHLRGDPHQVVERFVRRLPETDRRVLADLMAEPDAPASFIADLLEGYRQGGGAMVADLLLYCRPWGFRPEDIATEVHLWHGADDPKVPLALARRVAQTLPRCQAHIEPGGHLATCAHAADIVAVVRSAATMPPYPLCVEASTEGHEQ